MICWSRGARGEGPADKGEWRAGPTRNRGERGGRWQYDGSPSDLHSPSPTPSSWTQEPGSEMADQKIQNRLGVINVQPVPRIDLMKVHLPRFLPRREKPFRARGLDRV